MDVKLMRGVRFAVMVLGVLSAGATVFAGTAMQTQPDKNEKQALSLDDCIAVALRSHPSLIAEKERVSAAELGVTQAGSGRKLRADLEASYTHQEPTPEASIGGTKFKVASTERSDAHLALQQLLYDGGYSSAAVSRAKANRQSAGEELRREEREVVFDVTRAYYGVLKAQSLVRFRGEALDLAKENRRLAGVRYRTGAAPKADVLKAQVEESKANLERIKADNKLSLALASLNTVMGVNLDRRIEVTEPASRSYPLREIEEYYKDSNNRPELKQIDGRIIMAENEVLMEKSRRWPQVNAFGSVGLEKDDFSPNGGYWSAGVMAKIPLLDGGLIRAQIGKAKANLAMVKAEKREVEQTVALEVKMAYLKAKEAEETITATKQAIEEAEESLRVATLRYKAAAAPFIEVTDAQVSYIRAKTDYIQENFNYSVAVAALEKAAGK